MFRQVTLSVVIAVNVLGMVKISLAITVTPSQGGGPTQQQLAEKTADLASGVAVVPASANTTINNSAQSNPSSDMRAMGSFSDGITAADTEFVNAGVTSTYAGGIAIDIGVCLCTGVVSDSLASAQPGLGFGVEGPNNGDGEGIIGNPPTNHNGEITTQLFGTQFVDQDFEDLVFLNDDPGGGDATVLQFDIEISQPGFLRISFVFGSDEHPFYTTPDFDYNDSVAIIINGENIATTTINGITTPFNVQEFVTCGPPMFTENNTAPAPASLTTGFNPPQCSRHPIRISV